MLPKGRSVAWIRLFADVRFATPWQPATTGGRRIVLGKNGCGLLQIGAENFPGTSRKPGKQFSVVQEIDAQPLGDTLHPLTVGHGFEGVRAQPFTEFNDPFLMTGGAEVLAFA